MSWKEAYARRVNLPYYREVSRKELTEKVDNGKETSCELCDEEIVPGEKYFIYWRRMKGPQMIGSDGVSVCIKCDKMLEKKDP